MFNPAGVTLGEVSSIIRDFSIFGTLAVFIWKARGVYESVTNFFTRTSKHMDVMESGMNTLLTNHLPHLEQEIKALSSRDTHVGIGVDPLLEK
jgi:hypothetical protein